MKPAIHNLSRQPDWLAVRWIEGAWTLEINQSKQQMFESGHGLKCRTPGQLASRRNGAINFSRSSIFRRKKFRGFTLVELLIVIAIIALLMSLILPTLGVIKERNRKHQARLQMKAIEVALTHYYSVYSQYPRTVSVSSNDVTFGEGNIGVGTGVENSELMAVLLNEDRLSNAGHAKNPQRTIFLEANQAVSTNVAGVGPDLVYRDPWGKPYIISIDYNYDNRCRDSFYSRAAIAQDSGDTGYYGLSRTPPNTGDTFELPGPIMIWSLGPDGKADPGIPANKGSNKDNVLNWSN